MTRLRAVLLYYLRLTEALYVSFGIFQSIDPLEFMSNGLRPRSASDPTTCHVLPIPATRRLSSPSSLHFAVERLGEHPLGYGGYSDVWKAKLTRDGGATSLVCACSSHMSMAQQPFDQVALKVLRSIGSDYHQLRRVSTTTSLGRE